MPITPNNFKVTDAIGETDNFAGADVQFFHITLIGNDSSAVDLRTELGFDETMHNITRTILQRGTIIYQRIDNAATGRIDVTMERSGWTADTLETAIRAMGTTVGVNNKDVSESHVVETGLKLDNS
jgi:hypothetical protein|tara:strand:- start:12683 stop:13060 length:378 start_codon:yes stop_codon:yes gene_type:complete